MTYAGVIGILIAHLRAFGSGELKTKQIKAICMIKIETYKGSLTVWALYAYFSDSQYAAFELLM